MTPNDVKAEHVESLPFTQIRKLFVLLSGGVDSTTTLAIAHDQFPDASIECVSVDYGQRHRKEMERATEIAELYQADHTILNIQGALSGMLVDKGADNEVVPDVSYSDLPQGISPTYVSFRNGTMLGLLAARAQSWVMEQEKDDHILAEAILYCGVHADDAANDAYPDCTLEFIGAMANAIYVGTYFKVRLRAPLVHMDKKEVILKGTELDAPLNLTWSCYKGEELHCGTCPTCRARKEAFENAGVADPTDYAA